VSAPFLVYSNPRDAPQPLTCLPHVPHETNVAICAIVRHQWLSFASVSTVHLPTLPFLIRSSSISQEFFTHKSVPPPVFFAVTTLASLFLIRLIAFFNRWVTCFPSSPPLLRLFFLYDNFFWPLLFSPPPAPSHLLFG